jgi:hypothetical protein
LLCNRLILPRPSAHPRDTENTLQHALKETRNTAFGITIPATNAPRILSPPPLLGPNAIVAWGAERGLAGGQVALGE